MAQNISNRTPYWPDDELQQQQLRVPASLLVHVPRRHGMDNPTLLNDDGASADTSELAVAQVSVGADQQEADYFMDTEIL